MLTYPNFAWRKIFFSACFLAAIISCCDTGIGQCTSTGPNYGSSFANNASVGTVSWSTGGAPYSASSILVIILHPSDITKYLTVENFGFSIPLTASICGIQVDVERNSNGLIVLDGSITDNSVKIIQGGVITGTEHKSGTSWPGSGAYISYGNSGDTWGVATWQPSDINASNFGVAVSAKLLALVSLTETASVTNVRITVSYVDPGVLSLSLQNFLVTKKTNSDVISWTVSEQNDFSKFIVQRSGDMNSWENIAEDYAVNGQLQYSSDDEYPLNGTNYYRLLITNKDGTTRYSAIQSVTQKINEGVFIYPNPASSKINIASTTLIHFITIKDLQGRTIASLSANGSAKNIQLSIADLSQGLYVLQVDGSAQKFFKK